LGVYESVVVDYNEAGEQDVLKDTTDGFQGTGNQLAIKSKGDPKWPKIRESDTE
jgi:hypothetical protein